jgi:hypothetical protein
MIWDLVWIWVGLAALLTVISVWRGMAPKQADMALVGNNTPKA